MKSLQSHLLVAIPELPDSNFYRSVVLLIHHDDEGAYGVILNRPTELRLNEVWQEIAGEPATTPDPIYLGGPVEGPLIAVHREKRFAESIILPGVYATSHKDYLDEIVRESEQPFRLFSGYAGWGGGQLEGEIEAGGWLSMPAEEEFLFADHHDLWRHVADRIGKRILSSRLPDSFDFPSDPSLN